MIGPSFRRTLLLAAVLAAAVSAAPGGELVSADLRPYEAKVDEAVDRGLVYLAGLQSSDGSFSGEKGKISGIVSLAGMAFLAKGHTPGRATYGESINLCIDYVVRNQRDNGMLIGPGDNRNESGGMYSHTISTLFLSEVAGMTDGERQRKVSKALSRAVRLILEAQQVPKEEQHRGGWRYEADSKDSDLSCSGWALMALRSAKLNGAPVPDKAIEDAVAYIMGKRDPSTGAFGYQGGSQHHVTLTGAALLCLELTGRHGDPACRQAGDHILNVLEELPKQDHAVYGLYYSAQATFQIGGQYWPRFAGWMYDHYLKEQKPDGSWEGGQGRTYTTSMMVLALTVPYRQLPIYQRDETVAE